MWAQKGRFGLGGPNQFPLWKHPEHASRKKNAQIHTIIHRPQQDLAEKEKQSTTCTTDPHNIYSAKWAIYISKVQTLHYRKIQFEQRNSNKPTKTERGS